ncbi:GNAT family N-acetyltransferase [Streptomyces sp. NBC_00365]|uniref:GNAT family N-acetyltransferase n=1 Tax=Streptomyces sp. NBC_00365 TaxID=2975726 RepID=UPI002256F749|nr:GNAT family N-acetyltransferase [Streptomyces sp. NBC_00365]MCX5097773.1 GNAT family N-acetyltransferase [Streptomyces sp. NBC_00365]
MTTTFSSAQPSESARLLSEVPYDHPDARHLTQALYREQIATYGFADDPGDTPATHFDPPHGLFLIAHRDGIALGCGGIRLLDANTAEIKRMYVAETARGQGLGRHILKRLEHHATTCGATQILLETGARNHNALKLYQHSGYRLRPSYMPGRDPLINRALTKQLSTSDNEVSSQPARQTE